MLVSSPSPSSALRPSPPSPSLHPPSSSVSLHPPPPPPPSHRSSLPTSSSAVAATPPPNPSTLQYDPAALSGTTHHSKSHHLSPQSSRRAIEELRSALNRHTVAPSPSGPSGDHPCGRMSAGLTSSGGGTNTAAAVSTTDPSSSTMIQAPAPPMPAPNSAGAASNKRNSPNDATTNGGLSQALGHDGSTPKRLRSNNPAVKVLPAQYDLADPRDLVVLISSMLMELIRYNDKIPLNQGRLTRFHSRTPPRISVQDYLQRLATHATLSPPILLSMVYYIDRLCALYPAFTVSSLTIHRFLIASATVASKGLSDSFWTNKTYARVGGISMAELALLELEFLFRVEWRIVPQPEVLVDYYQSLVERCEGYEIQRD
ncbi:cyclin-domain-containing protein [Aspergillus ambiguus]|uniref:regulatory cyclin phoB n=1 Tax=Aspergillus ambiguus TaxID=176160 RepID=UPI003CCD4A7B